jgi:hypothetical protein
MLTDKISEKWQHLLEDDPDITHQGHWIGLYIDGREDHAFVLQCVTDPPPPSLYAITSPIYVPPNGMLHGWYRSTIAASCKTNFKYKTEKKSEIMKPIKRISEKIY